LSGAAAWRNMLVQIIEEMSFVSTVVDPGGCLAALSRQA